MQTVYPRNRLNEVVLLQWFVDVKHGIFRLIKACQQLIHHDHQVGAIITTESINDLLGIGFFIHATDILFPPVLHQIFAFTVNGIVSFTRIGW